MKKLSESLSQLQIKMQSIPSEKENDETAIAKVKVTNYVNEKHLRQRDHKNMIQSIKQNLEEKQRMLDEIKAKKIELQRLREGASAVPLTTRAQLTNVANGPLKVRTQFEELQNIERSIYSQDTMSLETYTQKRNAVDI